MAASAGREAPHDAGSPKIRLKGFTLDVLEPAPAVPLELDVPRLAHGEHARKRPVKWIVQFQGPVGPEHRRALAALGAREVEYVPEHALVVAMDDRAAEQVGGLGAVRGATRLRPAYKIDARLKDVRGAVARWDGHRRLAVRIDDAEGVEAALAEVHRARGQVLHVSRGVLTVNVPSSAVARLARLESVTWVEEVPDLRLLNDTTSWTIQTFRPGDRVIWDHGLRGRGQVVGMGDSGVDHDMCFFRDPAGQPIGPGHRKLVGYDSFGDMYDGNMGHGTHVAGTVAGDQSAVNGSTQASGMAPEARLYVTDLTPGEVTYVLPPADLGELFVAPYLAGARLHTNSWGASSNVYDSYAWSTDRFAWEHKDFLPLFANGNAGPSLGTVGTPATAKNVLSVGAAQNGAAAGDVAMFSSHGPAADGRTKPTLMAPGVTIVSADSDGIQGSNNCGTTTMSGTSMATPAVAGAAALVRQYYVDGYFPFGVPSPANALEPSAALVKATLLNGAQEMAGQYVDAPIPSTGQGWGRVTLDRTLRFAGDPRYLEVFDVREGLQTGAAWTETFFASGERPLKVTLVWTDYPASGAADLALVNDLDLLVTAPDATRYAGNVFADGASVAGGTADRLNVEEQVLVASPRRGRYAVTVTAHEVPFGPQPFAVVVTGGAAVTGSGFVALDKSRYGAPDVIRIEVSDAGPNLDPAIVDSIAVAVTCGADTETVGLAESAPDSGVFVGALATRAAAATSGDGVLQIVDGAAIVATYHDPDDGTGVPADATGTALADLTPPVVSSVAATEIGQGSAAVSWTTDEPASGAVEYGPTAALGESRATPWLTTGHRVELAGLREATEYLFAVAATDEAGNVARDANGGALYRFTTASLPPAITVYSSNSTSTYLDETVIFGVATDPSGVTSLLVNDRAASYRASDGYYELTFPLALGENPFVVVARDGLGNVGTARIVVTRNPPPDLTLASVIGPARGGVGESIHVEQSVCNAGLGAAPGSGLVAWFLSTDATISPETDLNFGGALQIVEAIAAGECLPVAVDLSLPMDAALVGKTFVVGSYVDVANEIYETDEGNNALAGTPIVIEGPDLVVSSVSAPASVDAGVQFAVPVTIANVGSGASWGFAVGVYLSRDAAITADDVRLASFRPNAMHGSSALSYDLRVTVASNVPPGEYYVGAIVDLGNEVAEADETNNVRVGGRVVVRGANLVAAGVEAPATSSGGSAATFTVTVAERGGAATTGFTVGLFLSTDATVDRSDRRLAGFWLQGLAAGATQTVPLTVTLPTDLALGTYRVGVLADEYDEIKESDETDNALAGPSLRIAGADLLAGAVSAPGAALPARTVDVTTTVGASAAGAAASGFYVGIYLSSDAVITASDTQLGSRYVERLEPGAQSTATTTVTIPSLPEGTYFLGAIADATVRVCDWEIDQCWWVTDAVKETDETNNASAAAPIFVGARADLVVSAVAGPATGSPGASVAVSTTVTNLGNAPSAASRAGIYLSTDAVVGPGDVLLGARDVPALAPGASSADVTTVILPADAPATCWLGAIADVDGVVAEANEANNGLAAAAPLALGRADLVVAAVGGPAIAAPGASIGVSTTVTNAGALAAGASRVGIYLSTDASIGAGDVLLGARSVPALAPGASSADVTAVVLPEGAAGTYWVGAVADLDGAIPEADEGNNALAASAALVVGRPDLVVVAVTGPATAAPGGSITVTTTVTNGGAVAAAAFRVGIYLSTDASIGAGDVLLGARSVPGLAPGASSAEATPVAIPAGAAGTYWLGAIADLDGAVAEGDEANNALAASGALTVGRPDLAVTAVGGPATAAPGGSVTVTTTVTNAGLLAAPATRVGIYLSVDASIGAGDVLLGTRAVPELAPGAASADATPVTIPEGAGGTYWLGAVADLDGAVAEGDEVNNALAAATPIAVSAAGLPNLAVTSVTGPGTSMPGQTITVTAVVVNRGGTPAAATTVGIYITADGVVTATDALIARVAVAALAPGASASVRTSASVPDALAPGAYYVGAYADLDAAVTEASETDNGLAGTRMNVRRRRDY